MERVDLPLRVLLARRRLGPARFLLFEVLRDGDEPLEDLDRIADRKLVGSELAVYSVVAVAGGALDGRARQVTHEIGGCPRGRRALTDLVADRLPSDDGAVVPEVVCELGRHSGERSDGVL